MPRKKNTAAPRDPDQYEQGDLSFFDKEVPALTADEVVNFVNARVNEGRKKGEARTTALRRADESANPFQLRRPFGLASLDCACGGGMAAGGVTQIGGPDGVGKDALTARAGAMCQYIYGAGARIAWCCLEHTLDKEFLRVQGCAVPSSELDLQFLDERRAREGRPALTEEERAYHQTGVGEFLIFDVGSHEQRLEGVAELVRQNYCQMVVVDSLAAVSTKYRTDTSLDDDPRQSASAYLLSEFMRKLWPFFSAPERGRVNLTTVVATNQARANRKSHKNPRAREFEVTGPYAIRHGKLLDLLLTRGERIEEGGARVGKTINWQVVKGKAGCHEGGSGELRYLFDSGFDPVQDLFTTASASGLILHQPKTPHAMILDAQEEVLLADAPWGDRGSELKMLLRQDSTLYWSLYYACLQKAEVSCLHRLV